MTGFDGEILEYLYHKYRRVDGSDILLSREDVWIAHLILHIAPTKGQLAFYGIKRHKFYGVGGMQEKIMEYTKRLNEVFPEDRL